MLRKMDFYSVLLYINIVKCNMTCSESSSNGKAEPSIHKYREHRNIENNIDFGHLVRY